MSSCFSGAAVCTRKDRIVCGHVSLIQFSRLHSKISIFLSFLIFFFFSIFLTKDSRENKEKCE